MAAAALARQRLGHPAVWRIGRRCQAHREEDADHLREHRTKETLVRMSFLRVSLSALRAGETLDSSFEGDWLAVAAQTGGKNTRSTNQ